MKIKIKKKTVSKYLFVGALMAIPVTLWAIFYIGRNITFFILPFQNIEYINGKNVASFGAGFSHFKEFFDLIGDSNSFVVRGILNSLRLYWTQLIICLPLSLFFSYFIFKKVWGTRWFQFTVLLPSIVSGFVYSLIFRKMIDGGPLNALFSQLVGEEVSLLRDDRYNFQLMIFWGVWMGFGSRTVYYSNAMKDIGDEVLESAKLDGVDNMFSELWYMIIPLIWPTISTFLVTGAGAMLMASGPLYEWYGIGNVPPNVYTFGFYFTEQMLGSTSEVMYPFMAAANICLSVVCVTYTYTMRYFFNKLEAKWHG